MTYEVGDKVKNGKRSEKEGEGGGEEKLLNIIYVYKNVFLYFLPAMQ